MIVSFQIVGVPEVCAGIEGGVARMQIATYKAMGVEMNELRNYVLANKTHRPTGADTIQQRSGNLNRSLMGIRGMTITEDSTGVLGEIGIPDDNTAPYARILHEGGTTRARVIEAVNAKALAFYAQGGPVLSGESLSGYAHAGLGGLLTFRKKVYNWPGAHFPARPYLADALAEQQEQIKANLTTAMLESVQ